MMCGLCVGPCECGAEMEFAKRLTSGDVDSRGVDHNGTPLHVLEYFRANPVRRTPATTAPYAEGDLDTLLAAFHGEKP